MLRIGVGTSLCFAFLLTGSLAQAQSTSGQQEYPPLVPPDQPRRSFDQAVHYSSGSRRKGTIKRVVLHTIEGPASSAVSWFKNRTSKVSAHYVVDFSGAITQMVLEKDVAWHVRNHNSDTIGIEHAGYARRNQWTSAQIAASARVVGEICSDYAIEPSQSTIVSHAALDPSRRTDPGSYFPWGEYLQQVKQVKQMADAAKKAGQKLPPANTSGISSSQGSANPANTQFTDASRNTGETGSIGNDDGAGTLAGAQGTGTNGTSGSQGARRDPLTEVAGALLEGALDGLTKGQDSQSGQQGGASNPTGVTARGTGSVNGGYDTLANPTTTSSTRPAPPTRSNPGTSDSDGSSRSAPRDDTVPASAPRSNDRDAGSNPGTRTAPPTRRNPDPGADTTQAGRDGANQDAEADPDGDRSDSSYGGFTRRADGLLDTRPRSRSRGRGEPGDARRDRAEAEGPRTAREEAEAQAELDGEVAEALRVLQGLGYKRVAAAGIVASLIEETDLNTSVIEGSLQDVRSAGVGYWTDTGLDALWSAAARRGVDWDRLDFQLEHLDGELARDQASLRRRLREARSPEVAARIFASGLFDLDRTRHRVELDRRAELARAIFEGRLGTEARASAAQERTSERTTRRAEPQERAAMQWDDY